MSPQRKKFYKKLDNYTCIYCGNKLSEEEATVDHIVPYSLGGCNSYFNIVVACQYCNLNKGDFMPRKFKSELFRRAGGYKFLQWGNNKDFYLDITLYYYCAGVFKYLPNRQYQEVYF